MHLFLFFQGLGVSNDPEKFAIRRFRHQTHGGCMHSSAGEGEKKSLGAGLHAM